MATVIDTLFLELGIDSGKFGTQAKEAENRLDRMSASFGRAEKSAAKSSKGLEKQAVQSAKSTKQAKNLTQAVGALTKGFFAFTALVMGSNALDKMIREGAQANVELDNLSRNIGISRNQLQAWGGMAEMAGGSAEGMKGSLAGLSMASPASPLWATRPWCRFSTLSAWPCATQTAKHATSTASCWIWPTAFSKWTGCRPTI